MSFNNYNSLRVYPVMMDYDVSKGSDVSRRAIRVLWTMAATYGDTRTAPTLTPQVFTYIWLLSVIQHVVGAWVCFCAAPGMLCYNCGRCVCPPTPHRLWTPPHRVNLVSARWQSLLFMAIDMPYYLFCGCAGLPCLVKKNLLVFMLLSSSGHRD